MASYNPSEDVSRGKYSTTEERRKIIFNVERSKCFANVNTKDVEKSYKKSHTT